MKNLLKPISYNKQSIDTLDIKSVIKVLKSDFLTQGPLIEKFENELTKYCKVKYAVVFSSGTSALHGACYAAGIKKGDEVITTPMTFAASVNCVMYCGGIPVFADKAIIPVDYSGMPADYDEISEIAKKHNLIVIADACHSLGATYKGSKAGSLADMSIFSFHPVKSITTGEGGAVLTNNYKFYQRLILFRTHGITKDPKLFINKNEGPWYYEMQDLGFNYRLTDIQAALGLSQLVKLSKFIKVRQKIAGFYQRQLKNISNIKFLTVPKNRTSSWHLFPIQIRNISFFQKTLLVKMLHKANIKVQVHYIPVHLQPYYTKKFGYKKGDFPISEKFYQEEISIPIYPNLTKNELNYVLMNLLLNSNKMN